MFRTILANFSSENFILPNGEHTISICYFLPTNNYNPKGK